MQSHHSSGFKGLIHWLSTPQHGSSQTPMAHAEDVECELFLDCFEVAMTAKQAATESRARERKIAARLGLLSWSPH
ncbi:hypothetical protein V2G26_018397 [Clonostachys chloroleuca]